MASTSDKNETQASSSASNTKSDKCPVCGSKAEDIPINNEELLYMCTNTECSYPFYHNDLLRIRKKIPAETANNSDNNPDKQPASVEESATAEGDVFDIQAFLDEQQSEPQPEDAASLAGIIGEILMATGTGGPMGQGADSLFALIEEHISAV